MNANRSIRPPLTSGSTSSQETLTIIGDYLRDRDRGLTSPPTTCPQFLNRLWYLPRNLPHFDTAYAVQSITYRLSDSLPGHVAQRLADELGPDAEPRYRRRIEGYLDAGYGSNGLTDPIIAADIIDTWLHFSGHRYELHAWCVMPNHVHVLIFPKPGHTLGTIVQSWKSWTGKKIKSKLGTVTWQRDYWDRFIRDQAHYHQAVAYIHDNPVKARLVSRAHAWPWSSAARAPDGTGDGRHEL